MSTNGAGQLRGHVARPHGRPALALFDVELRDFDYLLFKLLFKTPLRRCGERGRALIGISPAPRPSRPAAQRWI